MSTKGGNIGTSKYDDLGQAIAEKESEQELLPAFSSSLYTRTVMWSNFGGCSFVTRSDGKILGTYMKNNSIMLSTANTEDDVFNTQNAFAANESSSYDRYSTNQGGPYKHSDLQKLANGNYLLYINEHGVYNSATSPNKLMVYESTDGGNTFSYKSTVRSFSMASYGYVMGFGDCSVGNAIQLESGRILVPFSGVCPYSGGNGRLGNFCAYSDDNGGSWTVSNVFVNDNYATASMGIAKCGSQLVMCVTSYYNGGNAHYKISTNNGETWSDLSTVSNNKEAYSSVFWGEGDGYSYWAYRTNSSSNIWVYRHKDSVGLPTSGQEPYTLGAIGSGD